ncbi:MAG: sigma-70 family RNA polymerase sigma factor [Acidobacteria bacterium]|nr:sigma-70 family RNA polymerase sigma factor [Acidobacteriota bacterium]
MSKAFEDDPDVQLMLRVQGGDEEAFAQILRRYRRPVYNFILRFLQEPGRAEEIAQDVFLKVFQARRSYQPRAKLQTWIFKIATNASLKEIQRRKQSWGLEVPLGPRDEGEAPLEVAVDAHLDLLERLERAEIEVLLKNAMARLPVKERQAILLRKYQGMSYREIAATMSCSEGSVKTYIHRAKHRLQKYLRPKVRPPVSGGAKLSPARVPGESV